MNTHHLFAQYFSKGSLAPYLHALSQKLSDGHVCIDVREPIDESITEFYPNVTPKIELNHLVGTPAETHKPFLLDQHLLYMQRYFKYEVAICNAIHNLIAQEADSKNNWTDLQPLIATLFPSEHLDWQFIAAIAAVQQQLTIITGGPGTGKTTTVAKILALLIAQNSQLKIALAAPTGKASARLAESLNNTNIPVSEATKTHFQALQPTTIHRLLGSIRNSIYFKHNAQNPLPYDVLIVDECSMIDIALFAKMLDAIAPTTKVILLGDKNQLSSVEAGSLFGDLCSLFEKNNTFSASFIAQTQQNFPALRSRFEHLPLAPMEEIQHPLANHIVELQHSYRFKGNEDIGILSKAIIQSDLGVVENYIQQEISEQIHIDTTYNTELLNRFLQHFKYYIQHEDGTATNIQEALERFNHCRILAATRDDANGVYNLNIQAEQYLHKQGLLPSIGAYYDNKPILITENNYTLGLYNGDIGLLRKDEDGVMKAHFLERDEFGNTHIKSVLPGYITKYETCFAMTIHKSQGSEFDYVFMALPKRTEHQILTRELIYTGITRAKRHATIQADAALLLQACSNTLTRTSGLKLRLQPKS